MVGETMELRVARGRPWFVEGDGLLGLQPEHLGLSPTLCAALYEWAEVMERINRGDPLDERALWAAARRGRLLAGRAAAECGRAVRHLDPLTGEPSNVPEPGGQRIVAGSDPRGEAVDRTARPTGVTVSLLIAVLIALVLVVVSLGLAEVNPLLGVAVNLAVTGGFAPSVWLGRAVPTWRWVAFGVALGVAASWVILPLSLLG